MRFSDALKLDDPARAIFNEALDTVFDRGDGVTEHINRLSAEARLVYLLWCFDGEIHNGGFDQLFTNSLGNHCLEILRHLDEVGASKSYGLLLSAISWFPDSSPSQNREARWLQHESFSDEPKYQAAIDLLDTAFYKYEDDLASLVNAFVLQHPNAAVKA